MATAHALTPKPETDGGDGRTHLMCQSDVEREILALLRTLDEEDQLGALLLLRATVRRVSMSGGAA